MKALSTDLSPAAASVEGLDTFFDEDVLVTTTEDNLSEAVTGHVQNDVDSIVTWTLYEAADNLGVSTRTILRRLKNGLLHGHKISGTFGPEWRIMPPDSTEQTVIRSSDPVMSTANTAQDSTIDKALSKYAEHLLQLVEEKNLQLLKLSTRNGYLEAQLEIKDKEIALLEDHSRRSWWHRSWCWFLGRK